MQQQQETPKNLVRQRQQLREQFEEKSIVLDQTRRRLFEAEGFLIALKKERGLELLSQNEEMEALVCTLNELIQENEALEVEIKELESLVSLKLTPPKKTQKKLQEMLNFGLMLFLPRSEDFDASIGDQQCVLPLSARLAVVRIGGPLVLFIDVSIFHAGVDHRLDSKGHPCGKRNLHPISMVRHLRRFHGTGFRLRVTKKSTISAAIFLGAIGNRIANLIQHHLQQMPMARIRHW